MSNRPLAAVRASLFPGRIRRVNVSPYPRPYNRRPCHLSAQTRRLFTRPRTPDDTTRAHFRTQGNQLKILAVPTVRLHDAALYRPNNLRTQPTAPEGGAKRTQRGVICAF